MTTTVSPTPVDAKLYEQLEPSGARALRLFCFPYAGASAQVYRIWQDRLPAGVALSLVHLPGRGARLGEPPYRRLRPLIEALVTALPQNLRPPFVFYGHSLGALLAFELARELRARGLPEPAGLILSGRNGPQAPRLEASIFSLPDQDFINRITQLNGTSAEVFADPETRELFLPLLRADFEIGETYTYTPADPLTCPFAVYGGTRDKRVPFEGLRLWQKETKGNCRIRMFEGEHFFIHRKQSEVLEALSQDLLDILGRHAPSP